MYQSSSFNFARTKILATLGPATDSIEMIKKLIEAGLDGVRLNFSHGDYGFYEKLYDSIIAASKDEESALAVLVDLQGPKIRIGELSQPSIQIVAGEEIELTIEEMVGTKEKVSTSYKPLPKDAKIGDIILIDDGLLRLKIVQKTDVSVKCIIENGGLLKPKKGMNLPGMSLSTASVTEKDLRDLDFALDHWVDFVALSFVRQAADIVFLREYMAKKGFKVPIIAKIEKKEAVDNFEEILREADGIMVARGDLGVEMEAHEVPSVQKMIIRRCNEVGKLVITATQMLESMIQNPVPTRAEASDVANAVWDGTDVVMLSGETSVGNYPLKTVEIMNNIIKTSSVHFEFDRTINFESPKNLVDKLFDAVNCSIVQLSEQIGAAAIVVFTHNGRTPRTLSKFKPKAKIVAISDSFESMNNLCLKWGVTSLFKPIEENNLFDFEGAKKLIIDAKLVSQGDIVLYTSGAPVSDKSRSNVLRIDVVN